MRVDERLQTEGIEVIKVGPRAPNLNATIERFFLTLSSEVLDHFIVFGEDHLRHLVSSMLEHYHQERPHQGLGIELISGPRTADTEGEIVCEQRLGGLLKHFHRRAA